MTSRFDTLASSVSIEAARLPTAPGELDLTTFELGRAPGA